MQITSEALLHHSEELKYPQNAKEGRAKTILSITVLFTGHCSTELCHLLARGQHSSPSVHHPRLKESVTMSKEELLRFQEGIFITY